MQRSKVWGSCKVGRQSTLAILLNALAAAITVSTLLGIWTCIFREQRVRIRGFAKNG